MEDNYNFHVSEAEQLKDTDDDINIHIKKLQRQLNECEVVLISKATKK